MAHYLVRAKLRKDRAEELKSKVEASQFRDLKPFGEAISKSLENAKYDLDKDEAVWEEEDYCSPPLQQEKEAILGRYFSELKVVEVDSGEGWSQIDHLRSLWAAHPVFQD